MAPRGRIAALGFSGFVRPREFHVRARIVYRSRKAAAVFVLICATPFMFAGLGGLAAVGLESWYFYGGFAAAGLFGFAAGLAMLRGQVIVDQHGIAKIVWFRLSKQFSWDDVDSWLVCGPGTSHERDICTSLYPGTPPVFLPVLWEPDSFSFRAALFRVQGQRWPVVIDDTEAWRPSFDAFLGDVRSCISNKEVSPLYRASHSDH